MKPWKTVSLVIIVAAISILFILGPSYADWLGDTLKGAAQGLGRRAVGDAASGTYDGAKKGAKEAIGKQGSSDDVRKEDSGQPSNRPSPAGPASASSDVTIENAEAVYSKYDFVPGDRMIFFDDFSDTDVGEFPRRWTLNGPKGVNNNSVEVVEYQEKRFLRNAPADKGKHQHESTQYVRLNTKGDMPEKFTVEFDAIFTTLPGGYPSKYFLLLLNGKDGWLQNNARNAGVIQLSGEENISKNTRISLGRSDGKLHRIAVSVNGTFVKAYVDNARVLNDPDGAKRPITLIGLSMWSSGDIPSEKVMFTNLRIAEGGKNIKSALDTEGKIVTHGILFDTGKDAIKPESLPTLKSILSILSENPGLSFSIEGHTDNQGDKAFNKSLSERRAIAVRAWLLDKGIASERMKTQGHGDSKPIDSNTTPEGRANNRRVEFVKL